MKKSIAITLIFLFSATVLLSSASGYSDCAAKCALEMAKAKQHASMGSMGLAGPNPTAVGCHSVSIGIDIPRATQADLQFSSAHIPKTSPIYLQTLSILC